MAAIITNPAPSRCRFVSSIDLALESRLETRIICMPPPRDKHVHAKTVARLLASAESAGHLIAQAEQLVQLRRIAAGVLPVELRRSTAIANVKHGKVVIFAENAAVAARLRLLEPALIDALAREALQVTGLQVKVQVPDGSPVAP